ncbi:hypothetical protein QJQ45_024792 [Haematococcus lacustris]|nr:hypothetical protein QJQ45_024792 [Haematococcus lacustris]
MMWCPVVPPRKPPQAPRSSQEATPTAASEPGPSTPQPAKRSKRTKAEPAAEPTKGKGKGKAAKAKPAPQPGRWLDRDCNAALNMQRIGESRWRLLELCYWPDQGALPAKGKEYPGLGYKRLRDKPPKAQQQQQQQPAEAHCVRKCRAYPQQTWALIFLSSAYLLANSGSLGLTVFGSTWTGFIVRLAVALLTYCTAHTIRKTCAAKAERQLHASRNLAKEAKARAFMQSLLTVASSTRSQHKSSAPCSAGASSQEVPTDLVNESSTTELPLTSLPGSSSPHTLAMLPATRHPPPSQAPPRSRPSPQVPADSQASSISGAAGAAAKARAAAQARLAIAQAAVGAGAAALGPPASLAAVEAVESAASDSSVSEAETSHVAAPVSQQPTDEVPGPGAGPGTRPQQAAAQGPSQTSSTTLAPSKASAAAAQSRAADVTQAAAGTAAQPLPSRPHSVPHSTTRTAAGRMVPLSVAQEATERQAAWLQQLSALSGLGGGEAASGPLAGARQAGLEEERRLREEQVHGLDAAYLASLHLDQQRAEAAAATAAQALEEDARQRAADIRRSELAALKIQLRQQLPSEPDDAVIPWHHQQPPAFQGEVYWWVQSLEAMPLWEPGQWRLATSFPRRPLPDSLQVADVAGGEAQVALLVEQL